MSGCCDPSAYRATFSAREAERAARSFERRGLDSAAGPMIGALARGGLEGRTVLEVGAGVGTAVVALVKSGAERSVAVDISPEYRVEAERLFRRHAISDRVELVTGDITQTTSVGEADVVFLNKVICCYPDAPALLEAVTSRTVDRLAMSFPRRRLLVRVVFGLVNLGQRLRRNSFRVFVHPPDELKAGVEAAGLRSVASGRTPVWEWHVWERPAGRASRCDQVSNADSASMDRPRRSR